MFNYEYYEGRPERGVIYDWKKVKKEYDKLNVPKDLYYPCFEQLISGTKIIQSLSIRSTGKTTAWLLVGLCLAKVYKGANIQYIRTTEEELKPSVASKLTEVIRTYDNGRYIKQLTNGEYNDIRYNAGEFRYIYRNEETGEIERKQDFPVITWLAVSKEETYKSGYNTPFGMGDFILYDEFITTHYYPDCFYKFFNLFRTIIRDRWSPVIIMSANTTNLFSPWFSDFQISKEVRNMKAGDSREIVTKKGTKLYIEYINLISPKAKKSREVLNKLFFGFDNPKLTSITGENNWQFDYYPHIPVIQTDDEYICMVHNIYIHFNTEIYRMNICYDKIRGLHLRIHKATKFYNDSIILTLDEDLISNDTRYEYGLGYSKKLQKLIDKCYREKRLYFSDNETGAGFYEYLTQYKLTRNT